MTSTPITLTLTPPGPFSLAASIHFLEGFLPRDVLVRTWREDRTGKISGRHRGVGS